MRSTTTAVLLLCCSALTAAVLEKKELPLPPFTVHSPRRTDLTPGRHALSQPPLNEQAMIGDTVYLTCVATATPPVSRVLWYEFVSTGNGQVVSDNGNVLPSHPNAARYRIIQAELNEFILEITDVRMTDGGSYACADIQSGPPEVYSGQAELVVLQSHPNCSTLVPESGVVIEGQNYTSSCQLYYRGGLTPKMNWAGPEPFSLGEIITPAEIFSGILFTIHRSMDTRAYRVTTNFTIPVNVPPGLAGNAPNYEFIHQFGQKFVYWSPRNLSIEPVKDTYDLGDVLMCHADSFPEAFYNMQNMDTLDFTNGPNITVTPNWLGRNSSVRCQAQNAIQGILYTENYFISVYVPGPTTPTTPTTTPTTTTPLPDGACTDLTGWWISGAVGGFAYAELYLFVLGGDSGQVVGFMRNDTEQSWVEVVGRTRTTDYNFIGLTAIWPYEVGVTGLAAECHRCDGMEVIFTSGGWRSYSDSQICGDGGNPSPYTAYRFQKLNIGPNKERTPMDRPGFKVFSPSKMVSGNMGI